MAQRESGYVRQERDAYQTPPWVTQVLVDDLLRQHMLPVRRPVAKPRWATDDDPPRGCGSAPEVQKKTEPLAIWECAAGAGQMAGVLAAAGFDVFCSDLVRDAHDSPGARLRHDKRHVNVVHDFLDPDLPLLMPECGAVITNPPYNRAEQFVARALDVTRAKEGLVAMLLRVDWDSAKTRRKFFADCPAWSRKIVLLDRISWFDPAPGDSGPSENHAWYVWDWRGRYAIPSIAYAGAPADVLADLAAKRRQPAAGHREGKTA